MVGFRILNPLRGIVQAQNVGYVAVGLGEFDCHLVLTFGVNSAV